MTASHRWFRLLIALCMAMVVRSASAQEPAPKVAPGYEELFEAGQRLKSSPTLDAATQSGASLLQKRLALSDKSVTRAFDLMQTWLDRGVAPPMETALGLEGLTPALAGIRQLGRALVVKQYVLLADGRVREAVDVTRDGLRLGYGIQSYNLIAWLTGAAIQPMVVKSLVAHLDELSARDCDYLSKLAQDWVSSPDSLSRALEGERRGTIAEVRKTFAQEGRAGLRKLAAELQAETDGQNLTTQIDNLSPQALNELLVQVEAQISAIYQKLQLLLRTPYWERPQKARETQEADTGLAAQFVRVLLPLFDRVLDKQTQQQVMPRLLGCHAAILRYRWEHNSLPNALAELKLGDMAIDPFNGQPFVYKPSGMTYKLESIGPIARDENDQPLSGQRVPVTLTFEKK